MISYPTATGVLLAALVCFLIGGLWFSPLLFATPWMEELKVQDQSTNRVMGAAVAIPQSLLSAFVLGTLLASARVTDAGHGILFGLLVWLGFCVAVHLPAAYLEGAPRRFAIDIGHKLAICVAMGAILGWLH